MFMICEMYPVKWSGVVESTCWNILEYSTGTSRIVAGSCWNALGSWSAIGGASKICREHLLECSGLVAECSCSSTTPRVHFSKTPGLGQEPSLRSSLRRKTILVVGYVIKESFDATGLQCLTNEP